MTNYQAPFEQKWGSDQAALMQRVATLERLVANLTSGPVAVTSSTHPANPVPGQEILETDTGLTAQWNGTAWVYPPQRLDQKLLSASAPSIVLHVPSGPSFSALRVVWQGRSDVGTAATYMLLRLNGDSGNNYLFQTNQVNNTTQGGGNSGALNSAIEVGTLAAASATSGYLGSGAFDIPDALGSTFKAPSGHSTSTNSTTNSYSGTYGGIWLSTAAITSITLLPLAGNLVAGSAAYLYGET